MIANPPSWPNGAKCAVAITFDMDADSFLHLHRPSDSFSRVAAISTLRYGPEIAIERIVESYKQFGIKQTFFVPAWCIEQYPDAVSRMMDGGHEVAHHGYIHEHPNEQTKDEEEYWLCRSIEVIERATGKKPRGSRSPLYNFSTHSTDLLIKYGFKYDASLMGDDVPYILNTTHGELVELPSHWGMDDWPPYVHMSDIDYTMPIKSPQEAIAVFKAEFDAMWEFGGLWVPVWHPFVSGRLARWLEATKLIEYIMSKGNVWFATMEEIAKHIRGQHLDNPGSIRVHQMPYYNSPIQITREN